MGIYANSDFGQAKPTEMTARRSVTEGSVPADFGKNHYEAFALPHRVPAMFRNLTTNTTLAVSLFPLMWHTFCFFGMKFISY